MAFAYVCYCFRMPSFITERIVGQRNIFCGQRFYGRMRSTVCISLYNITANRYLKFRVFCQRYTYGITNAVFQQCADTYGAFDTSILAITCGLLDFMLRMIWW